jgi:hypothetical protein
MSKMNFIIWSYEDGPVRIEETNLLLKTIPGMRARRRRGLPFCHCEPAEGGRGNLVFLEDTNIELLRRYAPRNDSVVRLASPTQFANLKVCEPRLRA